MNAFQSNAGTGFVMPGFNDQRQVTEHRGLERSVAASHEAAYSTPTRSGWKSTRNRHRHHCLHHGQIRSGTLTNLRQRCELRRVRIGRHHGICGRRNAPTGPRLAVLRADGPWETPSEEAATVRQSGEGSGAKRFEIRRVRHGHELSRSVWVS